MREGERKERGCEGMGCMVLPVIVLACLHLHYVYITLYNDTAKIYKMRVHIYIMRIILFQFLSMLKFRTRVHKKFAISQL